MPSHKIFFYASLFFLLGVLFKSIGFGLSIVLITFLLGVSLITFYFLRRNKELLWLAAFLPLVLIGALYYQIDDNNFYNREVVFNQEVEFTGVVESNPVIKTASREFVVELEEPLKGKILLRTPLYPEFKYGDRLKITATIQEPFNEGYARYLAKNGVSGVSYFPKVQKVGEKYGSSVKEFLYSLRNKSYDSFNRTLSPLNASFLNGLTFGGYSGFTDEFRKAMSVSGTTHLVALSGYNISVITVVVMGMLLYLFSRRVSFLITVLIIIGFVVMTGAEASVVRAAIMGILIVLAQQSGRIFDIRNAVMLAALIMVLHNPKVLTFDIGFQLSFLALLGIVYLKPVIHNLSRMKHDKGFLFWRDNLLTTVSAQLAVAPILIMNFGSFSPVSFAANVAVLELIPVTMGLGFILAGVALFSYYGALVIAPLVGILLSIEVGLIKLFAELSIPFNPDLSWGGVIVYYVLLAALVYKFRQLQQPTLL